MKIPNTEMLKTKLSTNQTADKILQGQSSFSYKKTKTMIYAIDVNVDRIIMNDK